MPDVSIGIIDRCAATTEPHVHAWERRARRVRVLFVRTTQRERAGWMLPGVGANRVCALQL